MEILRKRFKEVSHIPKDQIRRMQHRHKRDILQPRHSDGTINPDYVRNWGTKGLSIDSKDIRNLAKKNRYLLKKVDMHRRVDEAIRKEENKKGDKLEHAQEAQIELSVRNKNRLKR